MTPSTIENTEAVNPDGELRQGLFAAQAARIVELQAEIASRQEEVDELKARILDSHVLLQCLFDRFGSVFP